MKTGRVLLVALGGVVVAFAIFAVVVVRSVNAGLSTDSTGLAHLSVGTFGGAFESGTATTPSGKKVQLVRNGSVLTPLAQLGSGEKVKVDATVKRPGWIGWALGSTRHTHMTVTTPDVNVASHWIERQPDGTVKVGFDHAVSRVTYYLGHQTSVRKLATPSKLVSIGKPGATGTVKIAGAARQWLDTSRRTTVTWFPHADGPVAIVSPKPGGLRGPAQPITIEFSVPVKQALGSARPSLTPNTPGQWKQTDPHTLTFTPEGYGTGFGAKLALQLPKTVAVAGPDGSSPTPTQQIGWSTAPGSTLRLQQLLAEADYLPVSYSSEGHPVANTRAAQAEAATDPPKGKFSWKYANTPAELKALWTPGKVDVITRGAVMKFQDEHGLTADGVAGPVVWQALLEDTIHGKKHDGGYSYVYVHRDLPQHLVLWHAGKTVLTSPGNTGVPAAPTELGTFPVFEHLAVTTMEGENPDGSHYNDPGIKWVSYFNGGDALHSFNRASFGTPQSLGCVELPLDTAAAVFPYTPIGTLVTIED